MEYQNPIDLKKLFRALNYYKMYILGIAVVITVLYGLYACVLQDQETVYEATAQIYVEEKPVQDNVVGGASEHVISDYTSLVQSDLVLKNVQSALKDKYTINQLRTKISATTEESSNIITIKVTDVNSDVAKIIANQAAASVVSNISGISKYYNAYMVSSANDSTVQIQNNHMGSVIKVFVLALILICGIVACVYLVKDNIKADATTEKQLGTMILCSIPLKKNIEDYLFQNNVDLFKKLYVCIKDDCGGALMVTSPHNGDGKSLISRGLAEQFIKDHKKALLLTFNMTSENSELHTFENGVDVVNFDTSTDSLIDSISDRVNQFKQYYDVVLVDGEIFETGNMYAFMECCEKCLIVLDPHETGVQTLLNMRKRLDKFDCALEGLVFNKVKF